MKRPASFAWNEIGLAYQAFSTLCDDADWANITSAVAFRIAENGPANLRILDVGAGLGATGHSVRRRLYGVHNVLSNWDLYDPDITARNFQPMLMPSLGTTFNVNYLVAMPTERVFDSVLFCHSTYYIKELRKVFRRCIDHLLYDTGAIVAVAMPTNSGFFLADQRNLPSGVAEDVTIFLSELGLHVETYSMQSRFRCRAGAKENPTLVRHIAEFVLGRQSVTPADILSVMQHFSEAETDFSDQIIVARRK